MCVCVSLKYASQFRHRLKIQLLRHTHTHTSMFFSRLHTHITTPLQLPLPPPPPPPHTDTHTTSMYAFSFFLCTNKYSHRLRVQQLKQHKYSYTHSDTHKLHACIVLKKIIIMQFTNCSPHTAIDAVLWFYILLTMFTFQFH